MFGVYPTVGWQIDPFGHSATQSALLTGARGFDALFFGRADYQDMGVRAKAKTLEHVWRGEPSYGDAADVFTGNFASGEGWEEESWRKGGGQGMGGRVWGPGSSRVENGF